MHARASADNQCFVIGCSVEHPYILRFSNTLAPIPPGPARNVPAPAFNNKGLPPSGWKPLLFLA